MIEVSPSLLSGDLLHLADQLDKLKGLEHLHLDIDDGNFVRGISFGMDIVEAIAEYTDIPLDAHLEVLNPMDYVAPLCKAGVKMLCAHIESLPYPSLFLSAARQNGAERVGLAINLKTPVESLLAYADRLDYVIFVSVEADCDGLPFRKGVLEKMRLARQYLPDSVQFWVDGGVNESNLAQVVKAGADGIVVGRAAFGAPDPVAACARLQALAAVYQTEE